MDIDKMEAGREMDALIEERLRFVRMETPEPYSTDISAAWLVVEKFLPHFRIECFEDSVNTDEEGWHCDIWTVKGHACAEGCDTAPLAICRAALKAVER